MCVQIDPVLLAGDQTFSPDERVDWVGDELFSRGGSLHLGWILLHRAAPVLRWVHCDISIGFFLFYISVHQLSSSCFSVIDVLMFRETERLSVYQSRRNSLEWCNTIISLLSRRAVLHWFKGPFHTNLQTILSLLFDLGNLHVDGSVPTTYSTSCDIRRNVCS